MQSSGNSVARLDMQSFFTSCRLFVSFGRSYRHKLKLLCKFVHAQFFLSVKEKSSKYLHITSKITYTNKYNCARQTNGPKHRKTLGSKWIDVVIRAFFKYRASWCDKSNQISNLQIKKVSETSIIKSLLTLKTVKW